MADSPTLPTSGSYGCESVYNPASTVPAAPTPFTNTMSTCSICIDALKSPHSLPCGHVFCHDCLVRTIQSVAPQTTQHYCPTCRSGYSIVNLSPTFVPAHLRPYLTPSVRKLYLNECIHAPQPSPPSTPGASHNVERARLVADNAALQTLATSWRKRAEVHASATLGLLGLARMARDHAAQLKQERDNLQKKYNALKRKHESHEDDEEQVELSPTTPAVYPSCSSPTSPLHHPTLQMTPPSQDCASLEHTNRKESHHLPASSPKRRRIEVRQGSDTTLITFISPQSNTRTPSDPLAAS